MKQSKKQTKGTVTVMPPIAVKIVTAADLRQATQYSGDGPGFESHSASNHPCDMLAESDCSVFDTSYLPREIIGLIAPSCSKKL